MPPAMFDGVEAPRDEALRGAGAARARTAHAHDAAVHRELEAGALRARRAGSTGRGRRGRPPTRRPRARRAARSPRCRVSASTALTSGILLTVEHAHDCFGLPGVHALACSLGDFAEALVVGLAGGRALERVDDHDLLRAPCRPRASRQCAVERVGVDGVAVARAARARRPSRPSVRRARRPPRSRTRRGATAARARPLRGTPSRRRC